MRISDWSSDVCSSDLEPDAPVREIGKADEGAGRDAQQFVDHEVGALSGLQRLRQDRIIDRVVGIIGEVAVGVALYDRLPARDRGGDVRRIDLPPARVEAFAPPPTPPLAVAAADAEGAGPARPGIGPPRPDRRPRQPQPQHTPPRTPP